MHRIRSVSRLALLPAILAIWPVATPEPTVPVEPGVTVSLAPAIDVVGGTTDQHDRLAEAITRFTGIGLALPDLEVRFSSDPGECNGHDGLFESAFSPWRISICSPLDFVYEHELAHAWEHANVHDATREAFMSARGVGVWNGSSVTWTERGIEQAAFIIQQNLLPGTLGTVSSEWQNRVDAFEVLTGIPSPRAPMADGR